MIYPLNHIKWIDKTEIIDQIGDWNRFTITELPSGLEAKVLRLTAHNMDFVIKIWNKGSKPDVEYQYNLMKDLKSKQISVPSPYGWGIDSNNHQVLLMSYDGNPLSSNKGIFVASKMLAKLHRIDVRQLDVHLHRKYDFIEYFYPRITDYPDIRDILIELVKESKMKQTTLIHGDYNLGNILSRDETFTIADWTNAQLGDHRYDFCWASFLIWIYNGEELYHDFVNTYLNEISMTNQEMKLFESLACLRWLLLNRFESLPKNKNTDALINQFILDRSVLPDVFLL